MRINSYFQDNGCRVHIINPTDKAINFIRATANPNNICTFGAQFPDEFGDSQKEESAIQAVYPHDCFSKETLEVIIENWPATGKEFRNIEDYEDYEDCPLGKWPKEF